MSSNPISDEEELEELLARCARSAKLRSLSVESGEIFHSYGLHVGGKFFAFQRRGALVLKLPEIRVSKLIADGRGVAFDAGRKRPLKEWITLLPGSESKVRVLVIEAGEFVATLARTDRRRAT